MITKQQNIITSKNNPIHIPSIKKSNPTTDISTDNTNICKTNNQKIVTTIYDYMKKSFIQAKEYSQKFENWKNNVNILSFIFLFENITNSKCSDSKLFKIYNSQVLSIDVKSFVLFLKSLNFSKINTSLLSQIYINNNINLSTNHNIYIQEFNIGTLNKYRCIINVIDFMEILHKYCLISKLLLSNTNIPNSYDSSIINSNTFSNNISLHWNVNHLNSIKIYIFLPRFTNNICEHLIKSNIIDYVSINLKIIKYINLLYPNTYNSTFFSYINHNLNNHNIIYTSDNTNILFPDYELLIDGHNTNDKNLTNLLYFKSPLLIPDFIYLQWHLCGSFFSALYLTDFSFCNNVFSLFSCKLYFSLFNLYLISLYLKKFLNNFIFLDLSIIKNYLSIESHHNFHKLIFSHQSTNNDSFILAFDNLLISTKSNLSKIFSNPKLSKLIKITGNNSLLHHLFNIYPHIVINNNPSSKSTSFSLNYQI